jgi:hypothetical protein
VALASGIHRLGPDNASLQAKTYREGMAAKVGHDLVIEVTRWEAAVALTEWTIELNADARSLEVREGLRGLKPLTDKDRKEILGNVDDKVLRRRPVAFRSSSMRCGGRLSVAGDLTLADTTRPASFDLELADDGRLRGTLSVTQSEWGITPYHGLMGALKVRDEVDIVLDVALPAG